MTCIVSGAAVAEEDSALIERDETAQQAVPTEQPTALSAAVLRIGASLDLDTVLTEVVDGARALTGADCGAITTVDATGRPGDFVTSGLTEEEHRAPESRPDGRAPSRISPASRRRSGWPTSGLARRWGSAGFEVTHVRELVETGKTCRSHAADFEAGLIGRR